jgi:hypothetical protein
VLLGVVGSPSWQLLLLCALVFVHGQRASAVPAPCLLAERSGQLRGGRTSVFILRGGYEMWVRVQLGGLKWIGEVDI